MIIKEKNTVGQRICMLLTCLLMIVAITVTKNGRLLGNDLRQAETSCPDSMDVRMADDG